MSESRLLTAEQAAELLNVPKTWCLAEARANRLPHVKLGRYTRFPEHELAEWWKQRIQGPRAQPARKAA